MSLRTSTAILLSIKISGDNVSINVINWNSKTAGDYGDLSPKPTFVDNKIDDLIFFRNRLGIVSNGNIYFSNSNNHFDMFHSTVKQYLSSEPFNIEINSLTNIKHINLPKQHRVRHIFSS